VRILRFVLGRKKVEANCVIIRCKVQDFFVLSPRDGGKISEPSWIGAEPGIRKMGVLASVEHYRRCFPTYTNWPRLLITNI
jgi:hypothetical protein